ncbi:hypothetical protein N665_0498s0036 [Sinapis alba]|nr:hypothetical protein N665_0498s0036 [Sinapis alba]
MAGGGGDASSSLQKRTGVWWDLNTCPVPAGVEPRRVLACIESALEKEMGRRSEVHIYAMGNLEYISSDLLEEISSSGIMLIHAPCGGNDLYSFLLEWAELNPPPANVLLISCDNTMVNPGLFQLAGFTGFCAYPKDHPPVTVVVPDYHKVFVKEFVWETLLNDNMTCDEMIVNEDYEPLCICEICNDTFEICGEFITHLKSEEHIKELFDMVPRGSYGKLKHFCQVCNYPAYDCHNLLLHNESEEHNRKVSLFACTS